MDDARSFGFCLVVIVFAATRVSRRMFWSFESNLCLDRHYKICSGSILSHFWLQVNSKFLGRTNKPTDFDARHLNAIFNKDTVGFAVLYNWSVCIRRETLWKSSSKEHCRIKERIYCFLSGRTRNSWIEIVKYVAGRSCYELAGICSLYTGS